MKLKNPVLAKRTYRMILGIMPDIEREIAEAKDRDFRNRAVARLARLEQRLSFLRDALNSNESEGYDEEG